MIYVFFASGFEEIEAVAVVDILRRAELDLTTVGVGNKTVRGAHGITVECDIEAAAMSLDDLTTIVLPGGMPGTLNLGKSPVVKAAIDYASQHDHWICAICAAPSILGRLGLLDEKRFTCFPGYEAGIAGEYIGARVVRDGRLITGKGPGAAIPFALEIVSSLLGEDRARLLEVSLQ